MRPDTKVFSLNCNGYEAFKFWLIKIKTFIFYQIWVLVYSQDKYKEKAVTCLLENRDFWVVWNMRKIWRFDVCYWLLYCLFLKIKIAIQWTLTKCWEILSSKPPALEGAAPSSEDICSVYNGVAGGLQILVFWVFWLCSLPCFFKRLTK